MQASKILIVRLGALGDVLHAVPAQQSLRCSFPDAEIHWLTEPPYRELLQAVPGLDRVWTADTKGWRIRPARLGELFQLVRKLRGRRFDMAFDFQGLLKSALLARLAAPAEIFGFRAERFKEGAASRFYSRAVDGEADLGRHVIEANLSLVSSVTGTGNGTGPLIPLQIPEEVSKGVDQRLKEAGLDPQSEGHRPVLINPGAGWATKVWPTRSFALLGAEVERRLGIPCVFTYGPREEPLIEEVRRSWASDGVKAFPTSILELAALCRRSRLMVAGDTGPLHLAAALGTPVVAVMGPTTAARNGPFDPRDEVVQRRLPCSDCYKRSCNAFICMNIPVEEVLRSVVRRLRETGNQPRF